MMMMMMKFGTQERVTLCYVC